MLTPHNIAALVNRIDEDYRYPIEVAIFRAVMVLREIDPQGQRGLLMLVEAPVRDALRACFAVIETAPARDKINQRDTINRYERHLIREKLLAHFWRATPAVPYEVVSEALDGQCFKNDLRRIELQILIVVARLQREADAGEGPGEEDRADLDALNGLFVRLDAALSRPPPGLIDAAPDLPDPFDDRTPLSRFA